MGEKVYYKDGASPDTNHPRAGWYCLVDDHGEEKLFGPFTTEPHAHEFKEHAETVHDEPPH